jgi:hypothetical protein
MEFNNVKFWALNYIKGVNPSMLMQPKMGCHLIFWWGLQSTRWQSTWVKGILLVHGGAHYHVGQKNI